MKSNPSWELNPVIYGTLVKLPLDIIFLGVSDMNTSSEYASGISTDGTNGIPMLFRMSSWVKIFSAATTRVSLGIALKNPEI